MDTEILITMAIIYDINVLRSANHMRAHSHATSRTVWQAQELSNMVKSLNERVLKTQKTMSTVDGIFESHLVAINKSLDFARQCEKAWELDNIKEMMACYRRLSKKRHHCG